MTNNSDRLNLALERLLKDGNSLLANHARQALDERDARFLEILEKASIPQVGWDDEMIEYTLWRLSSMDNNNNSDICGVGEREGRIFSKLVGRRHYNFAHGIGRSGNIGEIQPKAPGSAILQKLCDRLASHALRIAGLRIGKLNSVRVYPLSTGMSLTLTLRTIGALRPSAKFVLMPRIDQKSCIKCVKTAGLELVVVPNIIDGDQVKTDLGMLSKLFVDLGPENVVAVISVGSCFAPRVCDDMVGIAKLCQLNNIPHIVNNAYGLQSNQAINRLNVAIKDWRVDAVIQSTDKNFMVPVGGAIIISTFVLGDKVAKMYPGRANSSPLIDLLITLLSMGVDGYRRLLDSRRECFLYLRSRLAELPVKILNTPHNDISMAITFNNGGLSTYFGSQLFCRAISGARVVVVAPSTRAIVEDTELVNYGSHHDAYHTSYLTIASSIGQTKEEIDVFLKRLSKLLLTHARIKP